MDTIVSTSRNVISAYELPSPSGISHVLPIHVYNLPLYEGFLVLDTRSRELFEASHIATSVNLPTGLLQNLVGVDKDKHLAMALEQFVASCPLPERYSPIVLYGDDSTVSQQIVLWLAKRLLTLSNQPLSFEGRSSLKRLFKALADNQRVWILEGGFSSFSVEFPFLCRASNDDRELISLPILVVPGIFLGSRAVNNYDRRLEGRLSLELDILKALGVTHVIVNGDVNMSIEDTEGIHCLNCALPDSSAADMLTAWPKMIEFIENARKTPPARVLLQFHGRSRSAGIIAAWAVKVLSLSRDLALKFVKDRCFYSLDQSLMHLDQLQSFETICRTASNQDKSLVSKVAQ